MSVRQSDEWFIEGLKVLQGKYEHTTDSQTAEFLGVTRATISNIKSGADRPSKKLKLIMADKLGYLKTVSGIALVVKSVVGDEQGEALEKAILDLVKKPKTDKSK